MHLQTGLRTVRKVVTLLSSLSILAKVHQAQHRRTYPASIGPSRRQVAS